MQGGKSASVVESAKEAAANVGASAWAGKEKSKAVVQEKVAKARARDPGEKAAADARAQERVREVEAAKQDAMLRHAAAKERATAAVHQPTLPEPPARTIDGKVDPEALPGARLVGDNVGAPDVAADTDTGGERGHVAGAPETTVVNDGCRP